MVAAIASLNSYFARMTTSSVVVEFIEKLHTEYPKSAARLWFLMKKSRLSMWKPLLRKCLALDESPERVEAVEREIDSIVFHVYGLSASEGKLVLDWLGERREALGAEMPPDWRKLNALRASAGAWKEGNVDADQLMQGHPRQPGNPHTALNPRL